LGGNRELLAADERPEELPVPAALPRDGKNHLRVLALRRQDGDTALGCGQEFHAAPQGRARHFGGIVPVLELRVQPPQPAEETQLEFRGHGGL
jgi:hypothetical protein